MLALQHHHRDLAAQKDGPRQACFLKLMMTKTVSTHLWNRDVVMKQHSASDESVHLAVIGDRWLRDTKTFVSYRYDRDRRTASCKAYPSLKKKSQRQSTHIHRGSLSDLWFSCDQQNPIEGLRQAMREWCVDEVNVCHSLTRNDRTERKDLVVSLGRNSGCHLSIKSAITPFTFMK